MMHQYYAQRCRPNSTDPRDKRIGTISVGTILYIQDRVRPFGGFSGRIVCREPWMVEAWIPRDYSRFGCGQWRTVRIAGGHLAQVRSLRDRRRTELVADWILLRCMDAGLEKI